MLWTTKNYCMNYDIMIFITWIILNLLTTYNNSYFNNVLNSSKKLASFIFTILKLCTLCDYIFYVKEGKIFAFLHFHSFPSWWSSRMRIKCSHILELQKKKISMGKRWMILDSMYLYSIPNVQVQHTLQHYHKSECQIVVKTNIKCYKCSVKMLWLKSTTGM